MTIPTYDEDLCAPVQCRCGRMIVHGPCSTPLRCPFEASRQPVHQRGRWGAIWAQDGEGE